MQIIRVAAKEFKGLKFVEILPKKTTTIVGGKNRAGKSSLLDAIAAAIGGKKLCPEHPIRRGQEKGYVEVEVDGEPGKLIPACTIRRDFWRKKSGETESKLEMITKEGYRAPSPQTLLADITGALGFDPESFLRMSAKEQAEMLRVLVGLDFSSLDKAYADVYATRKTVNANGVQLKVDFERMPFHADAPKGEISAAELINELQRRRAANAINQAAREDCERAAKLTVELDAKSINLKTKIDELQKQVHAALIEFADLEKQNDSAKLAWHASHEVASGLVDHDLSEVEQQIADSETINRKVRANARRAAMERALESERAKSSLLTEKLKTIENEKNQLRAAAKWPVPGLGYDDSGVTYNEIPFDQCSSSEQRRVAVSIACSLNPTLKFFFIKDGSLLDEESKAEFALLAADHGCQCFMEVVGAGEGTSIVIADGEIEWAEQGMLPLEKAAELPEEPTH